LDFIGDRLVFIQCFRLDQPLPARNEKIDEAMASNPPISAEQIDAVKNYARKANAA
jgi:hypothetical protein